MKVLEQISNANDAINEVEKKVSKIREAAEEHKALLRDLPKRVFNYGYNNIKSFKGEQKDLITLIDSFKDFRTTNGMSMDEYHDKRIKMVRKNFTMHQHGSIDYVMMYKKSREDKSILNILSEQDASCYFRDDFPATMVYQEIDGITYYLGSGMSLGDSIDRRSYVVTESKIEGLLNATLYVQMVSNVTFEPVHGWSHTILVKESDFLKQTEIDAPKIPKAPVTGAYMLEGMAYVEDKMGD